MSSSAVTVDAFDRISIRYFSDNDLKNLRNKWGNLSIREERPDIINVPQCVITPGTLRHSKVSGVYDQENQLVDGSARVRGAGNRPDSEPEPQDFEQTIHDRRAAYYLGRGAAHFGHFLLETFCRAWAWEDCGGDRVPLLQTSIPPFARALYKLIPGDLAERIEIVSVTTRFADVLVPKPGFVLRREAYVEFKRMCKRIAERTSLSHSRNSGQPVYLSRSALEMRRGVLGEKRLECLLEKEGFLIVHPETLPISEQIALFNDHEWIVAPMSSACHTRLFACRPTKLIMLCRSDFAETFALCDQLSEGIAHYANVLCGLHKRPRYADPLVLDEQLLLDLLKEFGLVRPTAAFDGPPPDLVTYKKMWLQMAKSQISSSGNGRQLRAIAEVESSLGS